MIMAIEYLNILTFLNAVKCDYVDVMTIESTKTKE